MSGEFTARALRARNRSNVLRAVMRGGATTRPRLGRELSLSGGTVTNVVADLAAEGLLHEAGQLPSDGGRPSAVIALEPGGAYFIGADVGETGVTVELFDLTLQAVARVYEATAARSATVEEIATVLADGVDRVLSDCPNPSRVFGVGLGVPGTVESGDGVAVAASRGVVIHAQSLRWPATSLDALCAGIDLPIYADNGAKALASGEAWFGAAAMLRDSVTILHGRGIGAGIITGGRFLHGAVGSAGEWGHTKVSLGGPECGCGQRGCLEAHVGGAVIAKRWAAMSGSGEEGAEALVADLITRAKAGDAKAQGLVDEVVEILGTGIATLINIFNPGRVVIGGWAGLLLAKDHLTQLARATRAASLDRPAQQFEMATAQLGREGVALGAALLAVEGLIAAPASWAADRTKT